jgi:hypothetical protein
LDAFVSHLRGINGCSFIQSTPRIREMIFCVERAFSVRKLAAPAIGRRKILVSTRNDSAREAFRPLTRQKEENLMRSHMLATAVAIAVLSPTLCLAQASTATGAVGGAAVGAVVGGPVGAVVGGTVGAAVGSAAEPPAEVRTYVTREKIPSTRIVERVEVGQPLPATVELRTIPNHKEYVYAVVNDRRVIVEPSTRKIIQIIE